ncbi:alkaline phosphatase family protein [Peptococcaceae bacterium 1198_IL3148]
MHFKGKVIFHIIISLLVVMLATMPVFAAPAEDSGSTTKEDVKVNEETTKMVFLLIIDGLQDDALKNVSAPNIKGLSSAGLKVEKVASVYPADTVSAVASVLTGSTPQQHHFTEETTTLEAASILQVMEGKGIKTSLFDGTEKLKAFSNGVSHACTGPFNGKDSLVIENAVNELKDSNTYFNVLVLPQLRSIYQQQGINSNEYREQLKDTDNQVGRLLHFLHTNELYDQSLIIITGTCGNLPLIIKGPQVKVGDTIPPASLIDIAPTVAYLNGLKMDGAEGLVLYNAIKPKGNRTESYLLSQRVQELSGAYANALDDMHRLEEEKNEVNKQQKKITQEKQMIQQEIKERDQKISALSSKITFMKVAGISLLIIFIIGYIIEYIILRKRFLMF